MARSVWLAPEFMAVSHLVVDDMPPVRVPLGTMDPFAYELPAGIHSLSILTPFDVYLDRLPFDVDDGKLTMLTVFPAVRYYIGSKNVRPVLTIEIVQRPTDHLGAPIAVTPSSRPVNVDVDGGASP